MSERVRVTLLSVEIGKQEKTGSEGAVQGDGGRYYYLPGASYDETVAALKAAGFRLSDRFLDAVHGASRGGEHESSA